MTRYWFRLNPGTNKIVDISVGLHHLNPIEEDEGVVYYVDDSWMVNLKNGETNREAYVADKDEYFNNKSKITNFVAPAAETVLMLEVRGHGFSIWVDDKLIIDKHYFKDPEIGGDNVYVCFDFDATDGDTVHVFGYDEFPQHEPDYKPTTVLTPAGGKPSPAKPAAKPTTPAKPAPAKPATAAKK